MAERFKFELNRAGVRELMRSSETAGVCKDYAESARSRLGEGYEVSVMTGKNRVNAEVAAVSYNARKENLANNTILKALG